MECSKKLLVILSMFVFVMVTSLPGMTSAQTNTDSSPFSGKVNDEKNPFSSGGDHTTQKTKNKSTFLDDIQAKANTAYAPLFRVAISAFSIIFILGVVGMLFALTTKNGQWMKWSTGAMIGSFFVVIVIRAGVYILYSSEVTRLDDFLTDFLRFVSTVTLILSPFMLVCGFRLQMLYRGTEQPEYYRWARRVMVGSVSLCLLSVAMPWLFTKV